MFAPVHSRSGGGLEKLNRRVNEMTIQAATAVPESGGSDTAPAQL
jgi:hypothetical protein